MSRTDAICLRCRKPIERDGQTCVFEGQRWPCVSEDHPRVFDAPVGGKTLRIKSGWGINPVPILDDPYAE